ncbi:MAG: hypothetical protein HLX50_14800 [Alteromonadaceae bacterium]|nr:hypothetical protein [Alteromonadaceae bacterium]
MNIEKLERHITALVSALKPDQAFGITRVQRMTRLGYVEANELVRFGLNTGYLKRCDSSPYKFYIVPGDTR